MFKGKLCPVLTIVKNWFYTVSVVWTLFNGITILLCPKVTSQFLIMQLITMIEILY